MAAVLPSAVGDPGVLAAAAALPALLRAAAERPAGPPGRRPAGGRLLAAVPWALPALVLLVSAALAEPPAPLALAGAAALVAVLGVAGWRVAGRLLPEAPAAARASAALVLATAGAVLPALALGTFGLLWPRPFLAVVALLAGAAASLAGPRPPPRGAADDPAAGGAPPWRRALRAAAFAAAVVAAVAALHAERHRPPSKLDDPSYHLAAVATWHHHGDLRTPKFGFGDRSTAFYPLASELVAWSLLAPLRDSDFVLRWSQLLYFAGTLAAAAAVARELGLGGGGAATAALLLLTVPRAFPDLALSAGNDHVTAFFAVAAVAGALRLARRPGHGAAAVTGAALGLLVGTKYLGVMLAGPLAVAVALALAAAPPDPARRRRLALAATVAAAAALTGGYTYLRNAVTVGNPLFPMPIEIAGLALPGWETVTLAVRRHLPEWEIEPIAYLLDRSGFGPLVRWTALPAALVAPFAALAVAGRWAERLLRAAVLALPAVSFLVFLVLVHDHRDVRYLFAAVALGFVAFAWTVARAAVLWRRLAGAVPLVEAGAAAAVLLRFGQAEHWPPGGLATLLLAAGGTAAAVALPAVRRRLRPLRPAALAAAATVAALAAAPGLAGTLAGYQERKYDHELIVQALAREAPEGTVVAYAGFNQPYPYYGGALQHRVEQVPTVGPPEARYYRWGGDASMPWDGGGFRRWRRNLEALGVTHLVLARHAARERRWVASRPHLFAPVTTFGSTQLWRFLPAGGGPGDGGG